MQRIVKGTNRILNVLVHFPSRELSFHVAIPNYVAHL